MLKLTKTELTQAILHEYLAYDINTGFLTWIKKLSNKVNVNARAGSYNPTHGYRVLQLFGRSYPEHHVIWCWVNGQWPEHQIDHIDHNRANNAIANLQELSVGQHTLANSARKNAKGDKHGIWYCSKRDRYISEIMYQRKKVFQRTYPTNQLDTAIKERNQKLIELGFHPVM